MTADVPKGGRRKASLESKFSISPSAYSATGSEDALKFTRKLSVRRYYRWTCTVLSAFLLVLLIAASAVYLGYTYLGQDEGSTVKVFRVSMRILGWDGVKHWLRRKSGGRGDGRGGEGIGLAGEGVVLPSHVRNREEGGGLIHSYEDPVNLIDSPHAASRDLRERINLIFRRSKARSAYLGSKVIALHGLGDGDLAFHIEVKFDEKLLHDDTHLTANDILQILKPELFSSSRVYFANISVDPLSLFVQEEGVPVETTTAALSREETTLTPEPPRWCEEGKLKYCTIGPAIESSSTLISYPNIFGHKSIEEVMQDLITFRETVDSECHPMAHAFFCALLQPPCHETIEDVTTDDDTMSKGKGPPLIPPCRNFCEELSSACGDRIPRRLWNKINCQYLPENGTCIPRPGCVAELSGRSLGHLLCDGIPDCKDRADESLEQCGMECSKEEVFHCDEGERGGEKRCIEKIKRCDGVRDCKEGGDEKGCVYLKSDTLDPSSGAAEVTMLYHGEPHSICGDSDTDSVGQNVTNMEIASWICDKFYQGEVKSLEFKSTNERAYLRPTEGMSSFIPTTCASGRTLSVKCFPSECGLRPLLEQLDAKTGENDDLTTTRLALPGEWPWEAVLLKDGLHTCDATLVSPHWVLTAASCFEGHPMNSLSSNMPPNTPWVVRLGALRPTGSQHPWLRESSLIGVVTSPTGSLALGRLSNPIFPDNYIGVVCLPEMMSQLYKGEYHSLAWGSKGDRLESLRLKITSCNNMSSDSTNMICANKKEALEKSQCMDTGFPGKPLLQHNELNSDGKKILQRWTLVGVDVGKGMEKELREVRECGEWVFEGVKGSLEWVRHTIEGINQTGEDTFIGAG